MYLKRMSQIVRGKNVSTTLRKKRFETVTWYRLISKESVFSRTYPNGSIPKKVPSLEAIPRPAVQQGTLCSGLSFFLFLFYIYGLEVFLHTNTYCNCDIQNV